MTRLIPLVIFSLAIASIFSSCQKEPEMEEEEEVVEKCVSEENIIPFQFAGRKYELVQELKNWRGASTCAVERGGYLVEINDATEQGNIYNFVRNKIVDLSLIVAPDGGNGSYVWLGANDIKTEGNWIWDGDNDGMGTQFWEGKSNGDVIGGLYNNWGSEPDDALGQDALGLGMTDWLKGAAGEWNDIRATNKLYFVIEYP